MLGVRANLLSRLMLPNYKDSLASPICKVFVYGRREEWCNHDSAGFERLPPYGSVCASLPIEDFPSAPEYGQKANFEAIGVGSGKKPRKPRTYRFPPDDTLEQGRFLLVCPRV